MNIDENKSIPNGVEGEDNPLLNDKARAEAEEYLNKRMNWSPRNDYEKDLYEMGLQSLLENYI